MFIRIYALRLLWKSTLNAKWKGRRQVIKLVAPLTKPSSFLRFPSVVILITVKPNVNEKKCAHKKQTRKRKIQIIQHTPKSECMYLLCIYVKWCMLYALLGIVCDDVKKIFIYFFLLFSLYTKRIVCAHNDQRQQQQQQILECPGFVWFRKTLFLALLRCAHKISDEIVRTTTEWNRH